MGTRLSHPIGHQVGSFWRVPHGVTSCIALPTVMRHLAPATQDAQRRIAEIFGVPTPAAAADALERFIARSMSRRVSGRRAPSGQSCRSSPKPSVRS